MKVFAIYDVKTKGFLNINIQRSTPDALRTWELEVANEQSMASKFPHDFHLYQLAEVDTLSGIVTPCDVPVDLGCAADFKKRPQQSEQQMSLV